MQYHHPTPDESVNSAPSWPLGEFARYSLAIVVLIVAVYFGALYLVDFLVPYVKPEQERWVWNHILSTHFMENEKPSKQDAAMQAYLQSILDRLPKPGIAPGMTYQIVYVNSEEANAMALPSGKIVVFRGLVDAVQSENGLAFVLGHELGHFAHRDHLRGMGRAVLVGLVMMPFVGDSYSGSLLGGVGTSLDLHFSRNQETDADDYGLKALNAAYGHAGGATEFFEKMDEKRKKEKDSEVADLFGYLSTHPISRKRVDHLRDLIAREGYEVRKAQSKRLPQP